MGSEISSKDGQRYHCGILRISRKGNAVEVFSKETDEQKIMQALKRCHDNLGHPSNTRLIAMLRSANANEQTIKHSN